LRTGEAVIEAILMFWFFWFAWQTISPELIPSAKLFPEA
jgi:hypothetical protein